MPLFNSRRVTVVFGPEGVQVANAKPKFAEKLIVFWYELFGAPQEAPPKQPVGFALTNQEEDLDG